VEAAGKAAARGRVAVDRDRNGIIEGGTVRSTEERTSVECSPPLGIDHPPHGKITRGCKLHAQIVKWSFIRFVLSESNVG
jgi:hypothetical protein